MVREATTEYRISEAVLTADRGGFNVDVKKMIGEVSIFESLFKTYLTAKIALVDDTGTLNEQVQLQGTEKLKLKIEGPEEEELGGQDIELELRVVSIVQQTKTNNKTLVIVINCISPHAYRDSLVKVSKSYYDQLEDISEDIVDDYLDVEVERPGDYWGGTPSVQGPVKIITPYISPLETVEWLMERATGLYGGPMFAWTSAWDQKNGKDKLLFGDFPTMLKQGLAKTRPDATSFKSSPASASRSFVQSQSSVNQGTTYKASRFSIKGYSSDNVENTLLMINSGAVGAQISNLDPYANQKMTRHHDIGEFLKNMGGALGTTYDKDNKIEVQKENKSAGEHDARYVNTITSYGTYGYSVGYHDVVDQSMLLNKMRKGTLMTAIYRNAIDVVFSGYNFTKNKLKAGDMIYVLWHSTDIEDAASDASKVEERRTGHYMIIDLRRDYLTSGSHEVVATLAKMVDDEEGLSP